MQLKLVQCLEGQAALCTAVLVHMALGHRQLVTLSMDFSEVDLQSLASLEVLVAALLPAQVAWATRCVFQLKVVLLILVGVEGIYVAERERTHLTSILILWLTLLTNVDCIYRTCNKSNSELIRFI